jgi:hypothetical protein
LKRLLDIALIAILVLSVAALFLAHEDNFARRAMCVHTGLCPLFPNAKAWNKIFYDLAVGALVTLFFYLLVVRLPDYQRRRRLKRNLKRHYRAFRKDCIQIMLLVADGGYSRGAPEALLEQDRFKAYFEEKVVPVRDRWHEFQSKLDERSLRELLTRMEVFRDEIAFVLNGADILKDEPFEFLKMLSITISSMKDTTLGYDDSKPLARFLWTVFTGRDLITGYRKEDTVKKMINAI